jgi:hypothetical protein
MDIYFKNSSIVFIVIIILFYLITNKYRKFKNKDIWYEPRKIIDYDLDGSSTSKQVFDIYTFSHISHGILYYLILDFMNISPINSFYISITIELLWEVFENSEYIINKYRNKQNYENYTGDSIMNSISDIYAVIFGFYITYKNKQFAIIYLFVSEILLMKYNANLLKLSIGSLLT